MTKEEFLIIAEKLEKDRSVLEEKLLQLDQLSPEEKNSLYASFRQNINDIVSIEKTLNQMEIDDYLAILKELAIYGAEKK